MDETSSKLTQIVTVHLYKINGREAFILLICAITTDTMHIGQSNKAMPHIKFWPPRKKDMKNGEKTKQINHKNEDGYKVKHTPDQKHV